MLFALSARVLSALRARRMQIEFASILAVMLLGGAALIDLMFGS